MTRSVAWITAREAAAALEIKLATLYAYTSRGLLTSVPATSGRGRRYSRDAVERLKARHDARAGHTVVAASALRFGEPTLETSVSEIRADGPYYRGHAALSLADGGCSFESVCDLLWTGQLGDTVWPASRARVALPRWSSNVTPLARLTAAVASAALRDDERLGASALQDQERARRLIPWLAQLAGGHSVRSSRPASVAMHVLLGLGAPPSSEACLLIDRALILCADHELNPSTFATRVAASTGADLYACLGAGLNTLSGPRHGGASARVESFVREVPEPSAAARLVRERHMRGDTVPGFGHPLYPEGDPRAGALLSLARAALEHRGQARVRRARALARVEAVVAAMRRARHPAPNLDLGLVALTQALGLPDGAAACVFAIGRLAGWVAHALEQRALGYVLRPRSRYVAPGA